jgi:serine protease Do
LKPAGSGFPFLPLMVEGPPAIGSRLYAIGTPWGEELAFSVTQGVVSGLRDIDGPSYLQTDASLNKGNSGGPLLSEEGKVVAVVTRKIVGLGAEGLAFGVPITTAVRSLNIELARKPGPEGP